MSNQNEIRVKTLLTEYITDNIPEYILEDAQTIVSDGRIQKMNVQKNEFSWDIEGQVQGNDFQVSFICWTSSRNE